MESKKIIGLNRELPWEMAEAHTLHHPSQSDGPQDPGWPAEEEPSPSEGQGELSYKAVVKQSRKLT